MVGGAIAGYGTAYFLSRFYGYGTSLSQIVDIKRNVFTLRKLQAGNTADAINDLEMRLDANITYFSGGLEGTAKEVKEVKKALKTAKEYRIQYPRSSKYPEMDKAVADVLLEGDQ